MNKISKLLIMVTCFIFMISCSNKEEQGVTIDNISGSPEELYKLAMIELESNNYDLAKTKFEQIEIKFPLSNEAVQSQIMSAFIEYAQMNYDEAIFKFNRVINRYPAHKNIDYAYYMRAMCYFEQLNDERLDGKNNLESLENFTQIINRFPNSKYARDSEQKIILIKQNMAAKDMNIALFYLKNKKYLAAMKRYKKVIDDYQKTKFVPEALHRLVEIYYSLGMIEDANKTAALLGYNYPESEWYEYSYKLLVPEDKTQKKSLLSKFLNKDDEK